eukprot:gene19615-22307_t
MNTASPIAETARLEAATETLAEYIGYLNCEIDTEQEKVEPNPERITALERELDIILDRQFLLTTAKHAAIYRKIEAHHFSGTTPQDSPKVIILGGQPGAGKSGLLEASKQDFPGCNVVSINGDELRYYHPQYREIQKADERHFAELTDPHARQWTKQLFDRAIETRRNILFEGTMREAGPITQTMARLHASGYQIIARIIAVSEHDSVAGIFRRYEEQKAAKGFGRWSNIKAHNDAYVGVPVTVGRIEDQCFSDRVEVYNRRGGLLYTNILVDGSWSQSAQGAVVIQAERNRCPTLDEARQRESEWSTILTMMASRGANESDVQDVRDVADTYLLCEYQTTGSNYHDEILRRIRELSPLERTAGTTYTLWKIANIASRSASGSDGVDWHAVDKAVVAESIGVQHQTPESVAEALCKYSPGTVSLAGKAVALEAIKKFALE